MQNRMTLLLITHDMDQVLEYAERVIVMENAQVAFDGLPLDLFKEETLLEQFHLDLPTSYRLLGKSLIGVDCKRHGHPDGDRIDRVVDDERGERMIVGQHIPGQSYLHRSSALAKIIFAFCFIPLVFLANNAATNIFLLVFTFLALMSSRLPLRYVLKGLRPIFS